MKLGIVYNFFDGEELLEKSILSIRQNADFVFIVYQKISNYNNLWNINNELLLNKLVENKLVDLIIEYCPNLGLKPWENELNKRNIGLEKCRESGCDYVLMMDSDEFYIDLEFKKCKEIMLEYDYSACQMWTYFKKPIYRINPPERYFVPFICKILDNSKYIYNGKYPVLVDPTRRLCGDYCNFRKFGREEINMHHYSFVRNNIRSKMINSSARCNFKNVERYIKYFEKWKKGDKNFHPSNPTEFKNVVVVDNIFGI